MTSRPWILAGLLVAAAAAPLATAARADVLAGVQAWEAGDFARAVAEWRPLALAGDADAQFNMGQAYKLGRGVPQDLSQAADWFRRAAEQNHLQAQDNLGLVLYDMGQKGDAMPWLQRSAERGEPRAQFVLGAELFNGERISRDLPRAYAFMKRAADAGLARAASALVQMDSAIPLEQRQQGLALAAQMEASERQARTSAMAQQDAPVPARPAAAPSATAAAVSAPSPVPAARSVPAPVRTADVPPSARGTTYPAPPLSGQPARVASTPVAQATPAPDVRVHSGEPPASQAHDVRVHQGEPARAVTTAPPAAQPRSAPATPAPVARSGNWRVQLGAFGTRARAEAAWSALSGRLHGAQPSYTAAGAVTRLQAGPYASRAEADAACAAARPAACFVVGN